MSIFEEYDAFKEHYSRSLYVTALNGILFSHTGRVKRKSAFELAQNM